MIRGLIRLVLEVVGVAIVAFLLTATYLVYDGLHDQGDTANCALVLGNLLDTGGPPAAILDARLDLAAKLYHDKTVPYIIVSGGLESASADEATNMARYLEAHGVPARAIVQGSNGIDTDDIARHVSATMNAHRLFSIFIVSDYYQITRIKVGLEHAGVHEVAQTHIGTLSTADAYNIARATTAFWSDIYHDNVQPSLAKMSVQAQAEAKKLKNQIQTEASNAKNSIEKAGTQKPENGSTGGK